MAKETLNQNEDQRWRAKKLEWKRKELQNRSSWLGGSKVVGRQEQIYEFNQEKGVNQGGLQEPLEWMMDQE